jgi:hypothetical protein
MHPGMAKTMRCVYKFRKYFAIKYSFFCSISLLLYVKGRDYAKDLGPDGKTILK